MLLALVLKLALTYIYMMYMLAVLASMCDAFVNMYNAFTNMDTRSTVILVGVVFLFLCVLFIIPGPTKFFVRLRDRNCGLETAF